MQNDGRVIENFKVCAHPAKSAIPRCSSLQDPKMLPAPGVEIASPKLLKSNAISRNTKRISLQFVEMSLQIANCRELRPRDRFASDCILSHTVLLFWHVGRLYRKALTFRALARTDSVSDAY